MDSEKILQLLAKQIGQAASEEERNELKELLRHHPEYQLFQSVIQSLEGEHTHKEPDRKEEELVEEGWSLLVNEMEEGEPVRKEPVSEEVRMRKLAFRKWLRIAAVLTGAVLISGVAFYGRQHWRANLRVSLTASMEQHVTVPYGAPRKMTLPDSSIVWLNAGSHIRYANNFTQKQREIYLDGEAYFEVKHDAEHPFLVHAGNIVIKVLGTAFNVQAYKNENRIETTLINGKVQVQIVGKPDKNIVLAPHEKLTVINQRFSVSKDAVEDQKEISFQVKDVAPSQTAAPIPEVAWLQDKLAFQNEPFNELAKKLERRYNVHIVFKDSVLEKERLNGIFENENIKKALTILQMTTPFVYEIKKDTVYLKH